MKLKRYPSDLTLFKTNNYRPQQHYRNKKSWDNLESYNNQARKLASLFRKNDKRFDMENEVRKAGPPVLN